MKQRFFFDGVGVVGDEAAVDQGVERAGSVFADPADSPPARIDGALVGAEVALDLVIAQRVSPTDSTKRTLSPAASCAKLPPTTLF